MAADVVQSQYEQLEQIAARFAQQADAVSELNTRVEQRCAALENGGWQGKGSAAFSAEMRGELFPAVQRLNNALQQAQSVTLRIRDLMKQAEAEAAAPFRGGAQGQPSGGGSGGGGASSGGSTGSDGGGSWTPMGVAHEVLDWAGFIPGLGAVPDAINAGLYAAEGDWANAALSGAAAIPIIGDAAKAVDKVHDVAKAVDKVHDVAHAVDKVDDAADATRALTKMDDATRLAHFERLQQATEHEAQQAMQNLSNKARGPVQTGVFDPATGQTYFGRNSTELPDNLHPVLQQRLDDYVTRTNGVTPERAGVPGTHSEIYALNQALHAREQALGRAMTEADLGDLMVHNVGLKGARAGQPIPRCANCMDITRGVSVSETVRQGEIEFHGHSH